MGLLVSSLGKSEKYFVCNYYFFSFKYSYCVLDSGQNSEVKILSTCNKTLPKTTL